MAFNLLDGTVVYSNSNALETVCKYAFDTELLTPDPKSPAVFGPQRIPRYAYRTYDCILASPDPSFSDPDLLVIAGLNARIGMREFARLRSFADRAAGFLDTANRIQPDFTQLTRDEVGNNPPPGSAGFYLYRAWEHGVATPELGTARVHKVLHHKRPRLVPLLDNEIIELIRPVARSHACGIWQVIWDDLRNNNADFFLLEDEFNRRARAEGTVPLSWLRLHDILLWMHVTGQWASAPQSGAEDCPHAEKRQ